ncbi:FUSC family protein [Virgibacillus ainsalahensis]
MGKYTGAASSVKETSLLWITIKQAFEVKKNPLPWIKAFSAGLCAAIPIFLGLLLGNFQYGLYGSIGSFTFLYMFNEPYALRAKKLFFTAAGLSAAVGLGTLLAPYPYAIAVAVGLLGALVTFIFGTLKIPGPAAIFFVLAFTITSAMEIDPSAAGVRAGFVFLGGMLSWFVAMSGWFFNRRGPETNAIKQVYGQLAILLDTVGTEKFSAARERTLQQIKIAEETLLSGYISWDKSPDYKQLYLLYEQANMIFSEVIEFHTYRHTKLPPELGKSIKAFANTIGKKTNKVTMQEVENTDPVLHRLVSKIKEVQAIINDPQRNEGKGIHVRKQPMKTVFGGAFHKNSIIFVSAIRYGFILMIAAAIAFSFNFDRSYWIPLSCAAVMLGSTVITTFHRAIQRSFGTVVGILIASVLLSTQPDGFLIAIYILILTFLTELFIPRNYAFAAFFFTSTAIFMAENATQIFDIRYFATARITDILIGCLIGLIGTLIIGKRSASSRLPHLISKTIRSQMQLIVRLFSEQQSGLPAAESSEFRKMQTNLNNLKIVYSTALGEIPRDKKELDHLWPVIFSVEQLGYLLTNNSKREERPILNDEDLSQLLLVFEMMAKAAKLKQSPTTRYVPEIKGYPLIQKEIGDLQAALQVKDRVPVV